MGCASCLVWRSAFMGSQAVMFGRGDATLIDIIDLQAMVTPSDGLT
jgi:hypothetical protein